VSTVTVCYCLSLLLSVAVGHYHSPLLSVTVYHCYCHLLLLCHSATVYNLLSVTVTVTVSLLLSHCYCLSLLLCHGHCHYLSLSLLLCPSVTLVALCRRLVPPLVVDCGAADRASGGCAVSSVCGPVAVERLAVFVGQWRLSG
jgi:hypothetical protein